MYNSVYNPCVVLFLQQIVSIKCVQIGNTLKLLLVTQELTMQIHSSLDVV